MFEIKYIVQWQNPNCMDVFRGYTTEAKNGAFLSIDNYHGAYKIEVLTHDEIGTRLICRVPNCTAKNKKELHDFIKGVGYEIDFSDLNEWGE